MNKLEILKEIQRTAKENGNVPLGAGQFLKATGIRREDWLGRYWARWGDAVREAGFVANSASLLIDESVLLEKYIALTREKGRFPTKAELRLQNKVDSTFPSETTFYKRFGGKPNVIARLAQYCKSQNGYEDMLGFCSTIPLPLEPEPDESTDNRQIGYVYLIQHGSRHEFKIGKTFNPIRREGEIILQLPEKVQPIHYIQTDDPSGIEKYWHNRFATKRKQGEWFALTSTDIRAFKKWKRIF